PLLLLASERSGTNLLRSKMNNHTKIAAPPPLHLFKTFYMNEMYYGDLSINENLDELLKDIYALNENSIGPWEIKFTPEDIKKRLYTSTFADVFRVLFELYTESQNKEIWFCKENNLFDYAWKIHYSIPNSKFIYLVRDHRDVFVSYKIRVSGEKTAFGFSEMWKNENSKCIRLLHEPLFQDRILMVKYEDLLLDAKGTFKMICDFAGVDYEESMLDGKKSGIEERTKDWENISKDIIKNNQKKFIRELKYKEIKIIEGNLAKEMTILNYQHSIRNNNFNLTPFKRGMLVLREDMKRMLISIIRKRIKSIFVKKWKNEYQVRKERRKTLDKIKNKSLIE
ncbi:MAG: sulfotransferase family protein, partial [Bacteroidota bacterium]